MKIKQDIIRVILVDYDNEGKEEKIAIQNPNKKVKKKVFDYIKSHHQKEDKENDTYKVIEYMIEQLVDVELNVNLKDIDLDECSYMFKCILHEINMIYEELSQEYLMVLRMNIALEKRKLIEEGLLQDVADVAELKEMNKNE